MFFLGPLLSMMYSTVQASLSPRSVAIVTYALCGFSNPASVGRNHLTWASAGFYKSVFCFKKERWKTQNKKNLSNIEAPCALGWHSKKSEVVWIRCHGGGVMAKLYWSKILINPHLATDTLKHARIANSCPESYSVVKVSRNLSYKNELQNLSNKTWVAKFELPNLRNKIWVKLVLLSLLSLLLLSQILLLSLSLLSLSLLSLSLLSLLLLSLLIN